MSRSNLQIKTVTFSGTGAAQAITNVGFEPQIVIIKGGSNHAVFRTKEMSNTAYFSTNVANLSGGILSFTNSGFNVGTDVTVNAAATTYYAICIRGSEAQNYFRTLYYRGTGGDARNITTAGLYFQPDILHIKQDGANLAATRLSLQSGDVAFHFNGNATAANEIEGFVTNGFTLGTSARTNGLDTDYYGFALKHFDETITSNSFTGTGAAQTIDVGFQPDWIILANLNAATAALVKTSDMAATTSVVVNNFASVTTGITSITSTGFTVGTLAAANGSGNTMYWIAGKNGDFIVPVTRTLI